MIYPGSSCVEATKRVVLPARALSRHFFVGPLNSPILRDRFASLRHYSHTASDPKLRRTGLYDLHVSQGGTMVPFGGYSMPVRYADQTIGESHRWTRERASLFDVGHMVQHRLSGRNAADLLLRTTPSSVLRLPNNRSMLSCFLLPQSGGVVDDTVITRLGPESFYLVTNAACRDKDADYLSTQIAGLGLSQRQLQWEILEKQGLLALQGPLSVKVLRDCQVDPSSPDLEELFFGDTAAITLQGPPSSGPLPVLVARTGYTGEDGFEISTPASLTAQVASLLLSVGSPERLRMAGLGARDSLRLEAGMCLYGYELDEATTPVEAGLSWIVGGDRREKGGFHGSEKILAQLSPNTRDAELKKRRVGLAVEGLPARGGAVLRDEQGRVVGKVTSGGPSPTLGKNIAMGYVEPRCRKVGTPLIAEVRGRPQKAQVVKLPFVPAQYRKK